MTIAGRKFIFFETCGGMTNQRIALVQGLMMAHITSRIAILPQMNPNGIQNASQNYKENRANLVEFEDVYDIEKAIAVLAPYMTAVPRKEYAKELDNLIENLRYERLNVRENPQEPKWFVEESTRATENTRVGEMDLLLLGCSFFGLKMHDDRRLYELYWSVDSALHFAPITLKAATAVISQVRARSVATGGRGYFNALHLRVEDDWLTHCKAWETQDPWEKEPRDNCMSNTDVMPDVLANEGIAPHLPLFIAGVQLAKSAHNPVIRQLNQTYDLVDKDMYLSGLQSYDTARDLLATVDFAVIDAADTFIGNSVSTFSALILLHRHRMRAKSSKPAATAGNHHHAVRFDGDELQAVLAYACYVDRYPDIKSAFCASKDLSSCDWQAIQWHWQTYGSTEGRSVRCDTSSGFHYNGGNIPLADVLFGRAAEPVQDSQSAFSYYCYVERYPDLYSGFCNNVLSKCLWDNVREHWRVFGNSEGRTKDCNMESTSQPASQAQPLRKWIFTITGDSPAYDEMIRVAVLSAKQRTSLEPIGLVTGEHRHSRIIPWLRSQGVRLILHTPAWKPHILNATGIAKRLGHHIDKSPLYGDPAMMLATFLRLDVAILGFVDDYVLYADVDIIFTGDVKNEDFGAAMPQYLTMGVETEPDVAGRIFGNAGVLLLNVRGMRRTYKELIRWVFSEENIANGLHFGEFGPGDQGALKAFYWERRLLRTWPRFNWKPYWGFTPEAKIVHFHGPKPVDYLGFFTNATQELARHGLYAPFYSMCKNEIPGDEIGAEQLAGHGCTQYIALWAHLAFSASLTAPFLPIEDHETKSPAPGSHGIALPGNSAGKRSGFGSRVGVPIGHGSGNLGSGSAAGPHGAVTGLGSLKHGHAAAHHAEARPQPAAAASSGGYGTGISELVPVGWLWILQIGNLVVFGSIFLARRSCITWPAFSLLRWARVQADEAITPPEAP